MTYREYIEQCRIMKATQERIDRRFIEEYGHRDLFGKVVTVRYRFRGRIHYQKAYFEGLEPFFRDMIPILKYVKPDGSISKARVADIYSLKQIEEFKI